jgi:hypothetical protein
VEKCVVLDQIEPVMADKIAQGRRWPGFSGYRRATSRGPVTVSIRRIIGSENCRRGPDFPPAIDCPV